MFLAGLTREALEAVANDITSAGWSAGAAVVDALDEQAVNAFVEDVASKAGSVDISFNLIKRTLTKEKLAEVGGQNVPDPQMVVEMIAGMAALRRTPSLADVAEVAAFLASDRAAGMTGGHDQRDQRTRPQVRATTSKEAASWTTSSNSC